MNAKYVVYCRVYRLGKPARNRPIGRTSRRRTALAVAAERNAYRSQGHVYGVETEDGRPVYYPALAVDSQAAVYDQADLGDLIQGVR